MNPTYGLIRGSIDMVGQINDYYSVKKEAQETDGHTQSVDKSTSDMESDLSKVRYMSEIAKQKAKISQEIAIASRISTAEVVEIEEYYDNSGEGTAGLNVTEKNLGITGKGQSISKRVFRFTGYNESTEILSELLSSVSDED